MSSGINWYWDEIGLRSGLKDIGKVTKEIDADIAGEIEKWLGIDKKKCKVTIWGGRYGLSEGDIDKDPADYYEGMFSVNRRDPERLQERGDEVAHDIDFFTWISDYPEEGETVIQSMELFLHPEQVEEIKGACGISSDIEALLE